MRLVLFAPLLCACGGLIGDGNAAMNENTTTSYPTRDAQSPLGSTDAYVAIDDDAGASDASIDGQDYFGFIYFQNESEFGSSHFDAAFFSGPQQWLNYPGCQPSQIGPCTIHVCSNFVAQSHFNAGGLSLSGGPYAGLTAGYGVPNTDYTGGASAMFAKGDVLGVSATGGDVFTVLGGRIVPLLAITAL